MTQLTLYTAMIDLEDYTGIVIVDRAYDAQLVREKAEHKIIESAFSEQRKAFLLAQLQVRSHTEAATKYYSCWRQFQHRKSSSYLKGISLEINLDFLTDWILIVDPTAAPGELNNDDLQLILTRLDRAEESYYNRLAHEQQLREEEQSPAYQRGYREGWMAAAAAYQQAIKQQQTEMIDLFKTLALPESPVIG